MDEEVKKEYGKDIDIGVANAGEQMILSWNEL